MRTAQAEIRRPLPSSRPPQAVWRSLIGGRLTAFTTVLATALFACATSAYPQSGEPPGWGATISTSPAKAARPAKRTPPADASPADAPPTAPVAATSRVATAANLSGDANRTRIAIDLSAPVAFTVFRMTAPFRVVVDIEDVTFQLPTGTGRQGKGLVTAFRYGLFAPGKARIVIDTDGPTRVEGARIVQTAGANPSRLEIELVPTSATELAAAELAAAAQSIDLKPEAQAPAATPSANRQTRSVIVIDPGHGGIDPGAQGTRWQEKDIVLAVAQEVRRSLLASRRHDVVMTRATDTFLSLDQRVKISRKHNADLFISIHADSLAQRELAQAIRGATIYTLSESASDDRARRLAEKENAADLLAGMAPSAAIADDQVRNILFDLVRRETSNLAHDFRSLLIRSLKPRMAMAKEPARSGPFKVLRQPGSPAVLIELGYISNTEDEKQMSSEAWQRGVGEAIARSVDEYLKRRATRND